MKKIITLFLILFVSMQTISCDSYSININYVYDGDTFYDHKKIGYRLLGIDTPEIKSRDGIQNVGLKYLFAIKARDEFKKLISKSKNIKKIGSDRYGRIIIIPYIGSITIQEIMIEKGLAIVKYISDSLTSPFYYHDSKYHHNLLVTQKRAHNNKAGMWSLKEPIKKLYK